MTDPIEYEPFRRLNHSELHQMARSAGLVVLPSEPREKIIAYLLGEQSPPNAPHGINSWRHGIMGFILDHWRVLETQLHCPAKSKDPRSCFQCVDAQVVTCLVSNKTDLHLIQLHRKNLP
jgi:hypothetical protein